MRKFAILVLLATGLGGCTGRPGATGTIGAGAGEIIGGGGDYQAALDRMKDSIAWTVSRIRDGFATSSLCERTSGLDAGQKLWARNVIQREISAIAMILPQVTFTVYPGQLSVDGVAVKARVLRQGNGFLVQIMQSVFDQEGWALAFHELFHLANLFDDAASLAEFPGAFATRRGLDAAGRCGQDYFVASGFAGALDPSYFRQGVRLLPTAAPAYQRFLPLPGGKFLVLSHDAHPENGPAINAMYPPQQCRLSRLNADLSLDTTFGTNGSFVTSSPAVGGAGNLCTDLATQSDGKIVLVGATYVPGQYMNALAIRLTSSGALDTGFPFTHSLILDRPQGQWGGEGGGGGGFTSVRMDSQGRIVLSGWRCQYGQAYMHNDAVVVRLTSAGAMDTTFAGTGLVIVSEPTRHARGERILLSSDGGIGLVGYRYRTEGANDGVFVARLSSAGNIVSTSPLIAPTTDGADFAITDALLTADDRFVVAGSTGAKVGVDAHFVIRVTEAGQLDADFGNAGRQVVQQPNVAAQARGQHGAVRLAQSPDGKLTVAGTFRGAAGSHGVLIRLTEAGALDASFKSDDTHQGNLQIQVSGGNTSFSDLKLLDDGKILVLGSTLSAESSTIVPFLARFLGSSIP